MPYNKHAVRQASHLCWSGYIDDFASPDHLFKSTFTRQSKVILIRVFFRTQKDHMLTLLNMRKQKMRKYQLAQYN